MADIVKKWKGFDIAQERSDVVDKKVENFMKGKFERAWKKFDGSGDHSGMMDMMEAHEFVKDIIPKADTSAVSMA